MATADLHGARRVPPDNDPRTPAPMPAAPSGGITQDPVAPMEAPRPVPRPAAMAAGPQRLPRRAPQQSPPAPPFINLCGDYRFLRAGYWALVDAELNGVESRPTSMQAATAQNAAACLLVAQANRLRCVQWKVARSAAEVEPPCLLVPVGGLTDTCYQVNSPRSAETQWRSATQNGTRSALAVDLEGPLRSLHMVVGTTAHNEYGLAWDVWRVFGVPLATVWFVESDDGPRFLGLDPLPLHELTERELRLFEEVSKRPMSL